MREQIDAEPPSDPSPDGRPASQISVLVVSPEEAYNGVAEFWCGGDLLGITAVEDGQLQLRIESRHDGRPWVVDTTSLALGLVEAKRWIATY